MRSLTRHHRALFSGALAGGLVLLLAGFLPAQEPAVRSVDFTKDVRPILMQHCFRCHGAAEQRGGLRLDAKDEAARGGHSGLPILGMPQNELLRRVESTDRTYWMPKGAERLTDHERETLALWVAAGTPWPDPPAPTPAGTKRNPAATSVYEWIGAVLGPYVEPLSAVRAALLWHVRWFLPLLLLLALADRLRRREATADDATRARWGWLLRLCQRVQPGPGHLLLGITAFGLLLWNDVSRARIRRHEQEYVKLSMAFDKSRMDSPVHGNNPQMFFGNPPRPPRPPHEPRLAGTYYRGNCERNPALFNGGNYLTARMHVALVDAAGQAVHWDDPVPADGLKLRFEIERARGTTDLLYTKETMDSVYLSPEVIRPQAQKLTDPIESLHEVAANHLWRAEYPVPTKELLEQGAASGIVYVYQGRAQDDGKRPGTMHYAIVYRLAVSEGRLTGDSEVWLGSLFWSTALQLPGTVPLTEWFDCRPIPEVYGPNSQDPALLGAPGAAPTPPAESAPATTSIP